MDVHSLFATLSDDDLIAETKRLVAHERAATAKLLQSLIEIDTRRLYLREGCSSLFTYCTQVLHLAEGAAYNRIEAARAARRFPVILDALASGSVSLTTVRLLSPHLTADNLRELLEAAHHKGKREVEIFIATVKPKPPVASIIRKVPSRPEFVNSSQSCTSLSPPSDTQEAGTGSVGESDHPTESRPDQSRLNSRLRSATSPLSTDEYKLQLTISRETHDRLRRAQDLLRHAVPTGDVAAVIDRALTLLLADLERRRCAATSAPRANAAAGRVSGRHIPAAVRRLIWQRDEGRCAFIGTAGRCRETAFLEFHHVKPCAEGGPATVENIQLRCRLCRYRHKRHYAEWRIMPRRHRQHAKTRGPHRQPTY